MKRAGVFRLYLLVIVIPAYVTGCATLPSTTATAVGPETRAAGNRDHDITRALYDALDQWRGTRYRLGGMSRNGIDCSGLTYVVYRDVFDRRLPRTTRQQEAVGSPVKRGSLKPGDLVFFKTGRFKRHVGIYLENGLFLHASASDGVRLSSLKNRYWRRHYWKARRVTSI